MPRKYVVSHLGRTLTFSQEEFVNYFGTYKSINAAGGLVENGNGEYLMIKRKGYWDLPKGKIEKGENDEDGALREAVRRRARRPHRGGPGVLRRREGGHLPGPRAHVLTAPLDFIPT